MKQHYHSHFSKVFILLIFLFHFYSSFLTRQRLLLANAPGSLAAPTTIRRATPDKLAHNLMCAGYPQCTKLMIGVWFHWAMRGAGRLRAILTCACCLLFSLSSCVLGCSRQSCQLSGDELEINARFHPSWCMNSMKRCLHHLCKMGNLAFGLSCFSSPGTLLAATDTLIRSAPLRGSFLLILFTSYIFN